MSLKIVLSVADPLSIPADLAILCIHEGDSRDRVFQKLERALGPVVGQALKRDDFTGKKDQQIEFVTNGKLGPSRVLLVGLGSGEVTEPQIRTIAARGARQAQSSKAKSLVLELPAPSAGRNGATAEIERVAAEGVVLGAYRYTRYLTGDRLPKTALENVTLVTKSAGSKSAKDAVAIGQAVGESVCIARDLINEPPNELYPESFAKYCQEMSRKKGLKCTVFDDATLERKGFKLMLAVGQGSERGSRLIHMVYTPKGKAKKRLVFVGKGLTFDTGGICIKPAQGMEEMKGDMGGGANVAALMSAIAALKPNVEIHGLIGSVENMPDGNAYRPGDVFGSLDGKSVEIINTDAEGRLVLADVLAYARSLQPDMILDNATLTGACVIALGTTVSAFYSNREPLVEAMKRACKEAGEGMWHMPLVEELREGLKSDWADLRHTADRWGGSITAALFLREFVGDVPWVHVDIAGPSMYHRAAGIYSKGGTGHGVLTFLKLIDAFGRGEASEGHAAATPKAKSNGRTPSLKLPSPKAAAPKAVAPKAAARPAAKMAAKPKAATKPTAPAKSKAKPAPKRRAGK